MTSPSFTEKISLVYQYERIRNKTPTYQNMKNIKELEEFSGHPRITIWRWHKAFFNSGRNFESLKPKKRGPKVPWNKPPEEYEQTVVQASQRLGSNPRRIQSYLRKHNLANPRTGKIPSRGSISNILRRSQKFDSRNVGN